MSSRPLVMSLGFGLIVATGTNVAAAPACTASLVGSDPSGEPVQVGADASRIGVRVGGHELQLPLLGERRSCKVALRSLPLRSDAILVSYTADEREGPGGSDALWEVACSGTVAPKEVVRIAGADFGHAALSSDGRTLFFSTESGLAALDLTTRKTRRLTRPPALAHCDTNDTPRARDVVVSLEDGGHRLVFERGGPCGFEADWDASVYYLQEPSAKRPKLMRPNPIASLVTDAEGALWVSDGACADPKSYSRIWTSTDRGEHWTRVPVEMRLPQPVRQIVLGNHLGQLAVVTDGCGSSAHVDPGWVYFTENGGNTWTPIAPPAEIPSHDGEPDSEQDPIMTVELIAGSPRSLRLWGNQIEEFRNGKDLMQCWESHDGGKSWGAVRAALPPTAPPKSITVRGATYRIKLDGVLREVAGSPPVRVFPRAKP